MLTEEQEEWINHLSDTDHVSVVPFDQHCEAEFTKIKKAIQDVVGNQQAVLHRGASALGISGQDEIDVYVPVGEEDFDNTAKALARAFGEPQSHYPQKRARFSVRLEGKRIDIFVINKHDDDWKNSERFYYFLQSHKDVLEAYRKLKEDAAGQSVRDYYRTKIIFINDVLAQS